MVRAPCCEKMGLKKGPWTPEEDRILISYIQKHGHANWRALPKQAGLLRCGKSCRLRWINYLRPDIKRGNFTSEEEDAIIKLHEMLGNRWSAIAAKLPGRTDNEIKNVWHTHLKKRLKQNQANSDTKQRSKILTKCESDITTQSSSSETITDPGSAPLPLSPQPSYSDISSVTVTTEDTKIIKGEETDDYSFDQTFPEIDESFWSDALSDDKSDMPLDFGGISEDQFQLLSPFSSMEFTSGGHGSNSIADDDMDFWYNILLTTGDESTEPLF